MSFKKANFVNWDDIAAYCRELRVQETPDVILAVHRGGLPIGVLLSHKFHVPVEILYFSRYDSNTKIKCNLSRKEEYNRILVVDDVSDKGESLERITEFLSKKYYIKELTTLTYAIKNKTQFKPNYFKKEYDDHIWLIFPWEAI